MSRSQTPPLLRVALAGFLAWIVPGLGHFYLGFRKRAIVLFLAITLTFWAGVAIGGVRGTVNWRDRSLWYMAELCTGGNTLAATALHKAVGMQPRARGTLPPYPGDWTATDVGVHYAGVAGLLNLLIIIDAVARGDLSGVKRQAGPKKGGAA